MSFIDDSKKNVKKYTSSFKEKKRPTLSLKEVSAGAVGGFVGRHGKGIDQLFAGPYHPDYSEIEQILQWQIEDRKEKRNWMEDEAGTNYTGTPDPIGGYYDVDTKEARDTYDILFKDAEEKLEFNQDVTPLADLEWKSTGWDYDFDEIVSYIEEKDFINTSETNMENVGVNIKYDDESIYAGENFINTSETNWEYINIGDK